MRKIGAFIWYQKLHFNGWIQKWSGHTPLNEYKLQLGTLFGDFFSEEGHKSDSLTVCTHLQITILISKSLPVVVLKVHVYHMNRHNDIIVKIVETMFITIHTN